MLNWQKIPIWLVILAAALAPVALAGPADIEGRIAYSIDGDRVTVEIERIANNTTALTTGPLYVTMWLTAGSSPSGSGHQAARHRITGSSNGRLGPGQYFSDIRWTLAYRAPPPGTYYVHLITSQHPEPNAILGRRTFVDTLRTGAPADDHGDSTSTATEIQVPGAAVGRIDPVRDEDYFRFNLATGGTLVVRSSGDLDAVGTLYDANGQRLAEDHGSAASLNFRIERPAAPGTYYVRVASYEGLSIGDYTLHLGLEAGSELAAEPMSVAQRTLGDLDGDGNADVLLRDAESGRWRYYPMDGRVVRRGAGEAGLTRDLAWAVAGIGDLDGDGSDDVLLRHADSGRWHYYPMDGRAVRAGAGEADLTRDLAWAVAGLGDFNGDGRDDVLLRHGTGRWHYYPMYGRATGEGSGVADLTRDLSWLVVGVGDFNGDGRDDVLLRRGDNGRWYYYPMSGRRTLAGRGGVPLPTDLAWGVAGIGDFNGDGRDDVLLRHNDGRWRYYPMRGRKVLAGAGEANLTRNTSFSVVGIGDMNGDGCEDVLLRHADSGRWHYYPMNGRRQIAGAGRANLPADAAWRIAGAAGPRSAAEALSISTAVRSPVQPFEAFSLLVAGRAASAADYDILVDLSGSGFAAEDTIEVAPVRVSAGRLLLAAPLPEMLAEGNAARRFAVRLRERGPGTLSNALTFTLGDANVPPGLAGHASVTLDVVLRAVYEGLGDPLLAVEAGAFEPGGSVRAARALSLSTAYSGAQAEALLRSIFGAALVAGQPGTGVRCEEPAPSARCHTYGRLAACVAEAMVDVVAGSAAAGYPLLRCGGVVKDDVVPTWGDYSRKIRAAGNLLHRAAPRLAGALGVGQRPAQQLLDLNATVRYVVGLSKTLRPATAMLAERRETYEAMRSATRALTEGNAKLIAEAARAAVADGVDAAERDAHFALVAEADHHQRDAAAIERLEKVYAGEADVVQTLGGLAGGGASCGPDYEEFPVRDNIRTCVWNSLVAWNCDAGSRQVSHPDLGGANACLYYSLDFVQPDGSCRERYAKVRLQGREICRWADLGNGKAAWYTLETTYGVKSPQTPTVAPGDGFWDCGACPLMVPVPAGSFSMGAPASEPSSNNGERPQRTVSVGAFAASAFEVTFAEWDACVADGGCGGYPPDDSGWGRGDRPVINVSWADAQHYVDWLSRETGRTYRLPTEAQWEYAARAGTTTPFHTGGTISAQQANLDGRHGYPSADFDADGLYRRQTVPVGSFAPNDFSLYDVHGNVWEWVLDCYGDYRNAPNDGSAAGGYCSSRILRGGSWSYGAKEARSAVRGRIDTDARYSDIGLRVVRDYTP